MHRQLKNMLIKLAKTIHCFQLVYVWFRVSHYALTFYSRHCKVIFYQLSKKDIQRIAISENASIVVYRIPSG